MVSSGGFVPENTKPKIGLEEFCEFCTTAKVLPFAAARVRAFSAPRASSPPATDWPTITLRLPRMCRCDETVIVGVVVVGRGMVPFADVQERIIQRGKVSREQERCHTVLS